MILLKDYLREEDDGIYRLKKLPKVLDSNGKRVGPLIAGWDAATGEVLLCRLDYSNGVNCLVDSNGENILETRWYSAPLSVEEGDGPVDVRVSPPGGWAVPVRDWNFREFL